ncbi:MAG: ISAs1 family transposase [Microbacteriaceae bacterium]
MLSSLTDALTRHLPLDLLAVSQDTLDSASLREALSRVPDPRARRGVRYPFIHLLQIIVTAVLSGANTLTTIVEWAQHAATAGPDRSPTGRVPSLATIHRTVARIDPVALDAAVNGWVRGRAREHTGTGRLVVAVDGKEVRGAKNGRSGRVFLMAALDHATGTVIGQESIGAKTNEIPHFQALMGKIGDLNGVVITADALHTQRAHADFLHSKQAHYVLTVKTNQRALRDRIASQTWASLPVQHVCQQKRHGRTTTWQATCQRAQDWIDFPHAEQTMRLTRDRHNHSTGETTREHVFAITSLTEEEASPAQLADYIRGHWGIENRLHWVRDVTYREDHSQIRTGNAAHVMASIRNLAISIHRLTGATNIAAALRHTMRNPTIAHQLTRL